MAAGVLRRSGTTLSAAADRRPQVDGRASPRVAQVDAPGCLP
jgi:hypothetical protein